MSLQEDLHREHLARQARLRGPIRRQVYVKPVPPIPPPVKRELTDQEQAFHAFKGPLHKLLEEVAARHGLTVREMKSPSRVQRLSDARREFYYRAADETIQSLPAIAALLGDRDHSSVIWGVTIYAAYHDLPMPRGMIVGARRRELARKQKAREEARQKARQEALYG